eukprot:scaffold389_cov211-Alexandrium_tamarense.AAC.15
MRRYRLGNTLFIDKSLDVLYSPIAAKLRDYCYQKEKSMHLVVSVEYSSLSDRRCGITAEATASLELGHLLCGSSDFISPLSTPLPFQLCIFLLPTNNRPPLQFLKDENPKEERLCIALGADYPRKSLHQASWHCSRKFTVLMALKLSESLNGRVGVYPSRGHCGGDMFARHNHHRYISKLTVTNSHPSPTSYFAVVISSHIWHQIMSSTIVTPTHTDVLFGRGVATNRHPGNENFRTIVKDYVGVYVTSTKKQKMLTSRSIVDLIQTQLSPPGRFLEKDVKTGLWRVVDRKKAVEKTAQTLRDGAAPLRKELSEDVNDNMFIHAVFDQKELEDRAYNLIEDIAEFEGV